MAPITKNIRVVDEFGKEYEATYPKRARGLVKNGRARFVDKECICLVRPPNNDLEDNHMKTNEDKSMAINDEINNTLQQNSNGKIVRNTVDGKINEDFEYFEEPAGKADTNAVYYDGLASTEANFRSADTKNGHSVTTLTIDYVLARIDKVLNDTEHIKSTLEALLNISVAGPGDIANAQRAEALKEIVKYRETTNQKLLTLYEKMYEDIKTQQKSPQDRALDLLDLTMNNPTLSSEEKETLLTSLDEIRRLERKNSLEQNISRILDLAKNIDWNAYPPEVQSDIRETIKAQLSRHW